MNKETNNSLIKNLSNDLPASIVVFLVAVPLCLAIAVASGAPPISGIIAGIIGGIVVGAISGSPLGVSGPAAGLAAIVLAAINDLGAFDIFLVAVVLSGVFQIILGVLKSGVIAYYFPSSVIKGMLSGIGIIIILKMIPHAFGYDEDPMGDFSFFQVDGHNTFSELGYMLDYLSIGPIIISLLSLGVLILWEQGFIKRLAISRIIQGPLVVVLGGILYSLFLVASETYGLGEKQLVQIPEAGSFEGFLNLFTMPDFSAINQGAVWLTGATIAVVASLETLLCVEATDKLDPQKRVTPTNRELTAQGIGNIISGLIGGLPITQVIVRSSANIQSGGRTKTAAIVHGILLLITVLTIPAIINMIPMASLAAILFIVGYKLAKPSLFKEMLGKGVDQYVPFLVTIAGIVFIDLLWGIGIGLAVSIVFILWQNYQTPYEFDKKSYIKGEPITISLAKDLNFIHKARIMHTLQELPENSHLILDATGTNSIHPDILEILDDFKVTAERKEIKYELLGWDDKGSGTDVVREFGSTVNERPMSKKKNILNTFL